MSFEDKLDQDLENLKEMAAKLANTDQKYPHSRMVLTQQAEHTSDTNLMQTPYRELDYFEMIKKFRKDNRDEQDFYRGFEEDRKVVQRSALKKANLLSQQQCQGCELENFADGEVSGYYPDGQVDCGADADGRNISNYRSHCPGNIKHTCVMKVLGPNAVDGPDSKSKLDNNFYRKVSKYQLDSNSVDFRALFQERAR